MSTNFLGNEQPVQNDNATQNSQEAETFDIHQNAIVNVLPAGDNPEDGPTILAYVINSEAGEDGTILVRDINGAEAEIPLERIQVFAPHDILIVINRYNAMHDVVSGFVDPEKVS